MFQVEFHVQESDGLFGDLVGKFDGGMEILHKVEFICFTYLSGLSVYIFVDDLPSQTRMCLNNGRR